MAQHAQRMALSLDREDLSAALEMNLDRVANPLATILAGAMLLRHSLSLEREAASVEAAVDRVLDAAPQRL